MGNGHAMSQTGGTQALAREQVVRHGGARDCVMILEQQAGVLEHTLLAAGVQIHDHLAGRKDGGKSIHLDTSGGDGLEP